MVIGDWLLVRVLFFQTVHPADDDRVYYHQRVSLEQAGHSCAFACSLDDVHDRPNVVICDTPVAVWRIRKRFGRKVRVLFDITEFYPSKKNLRTIHPIFRPLKYCVLKLANLWAGCSADGFLFGEYDKAVLFRRWFSRKPYMMLPYYPSLRYIHPTAPRMLDKEVRLFYAGPQTAEKGYKRVQQIAQECQAQMPDKKVVLTTLYNVSFESFCQVITEQDIFLDLRDADRENTRCLPIKLFYYLAAGRPVIYSDLKAIRRAVPEITDDSLFVPSEIQTIVRRIQELVQQPKVYQSICERNRQLASTRFNWETNQAEFIEFIEKMQ